MPQLRSLPATTKTQSNQINNYIKKNPKTLGVHNASALLLSSFSTLFQPIWGAPQLQCADAWVRIPPLSVSCPWAVTLGASVSALVKMRTIAPSTSSCGGGEGVKKIIRYFTYLALS